MTFVLVSIVVVLALVFSKYWARFVLWLFKPLETVLGRKNKSLNKAVEAKQKTEKKGES